MLNEILTFGEPAKGPPCEDCLDGRCTMNCSVEMKPGSIFLSNWRPAETAPKDGTHILVCDGPYSEHWGFNQRPPVVVHYWSNPGEEGFYLSNGLVEGSYNDEPLNFTHWRPLGSPPNP